MRDGVLEAGGAAMGRRGRDAVPMSDEKVSDEKVNVGIGMGEMRNSLLIAFRVHYAEWGWFWSGEG